MAVDANREGLGNLIIEDVGFAVHHCDNSGTVWILDEFECETCLSRNEAVAAARAILKHFNAEMDE